MEEGRNESSNRSDKEIADYVTAMYSFDEVILEEVSTSLNERSIRVYLTMNLEFT